MYSEVAWIQVSLGNHVKPLIILDPDYPPGYLSISCDYGLLVQNNYKTNQFKLLWMSLKTTKVFDADINRENLL